MTLTWSFFTFLWPSVQLTVAKHKGWCCFKCSQSSQCFVGAEWCLSVLVTNECGPSHCWQPPQGCDAIFSSSACVYNYYCLSGPGASNTRLYSGTWDTHTNTHYTHLFICTNRLTENFTRFHCCRQMTQILLHVLSQKQVQFLQFSLYNIRVEVRFPDFYRINCPPLKRMESLFTKITYL